MVMVDLKIVGVSNDLGNGVSRQRTINLQPCIIGDDPMNGNGAVSLENFVGIKAFGDVVAPRRGSYVWNGTLYCVAGSDLYSVSDDGLHTFIGNILGSSRVVFDGIASQFIIVCDGYVYKYDGLVLTFETDADFETPMSVCVLNNQAIYDGDAGRASVSDAGDLASIGGLSYLTAESDPDQLVRVYEFEQRLLLLGQKTIEPWYNSGVGTPPFERVNGGITQKGIAALHAVADNGSLMAFMGNDKRIYGYRNGSIQTIDDDGIALQVSRMSLVSDACFWWMQIKGQWFLVCSFPTGDATLVYKDGVGWFEWMSGNSGRANVEYCIECYGKLLAEMSDGSLVEISTDEYSELGSEIIKRRDCMIIDGAMLGADGKRLFMKSLKLFIDAGVGIIEGQGEDPEVMLSFSDDGGKTFFGELRQKLGRMGEFDKQVVFHRGGSFYRRIVRISISDPVKVVIRKAVAEIEVGI